MGGELAFYLEAGFLGGFFYAGFYAHLRSEQRGQQYGKVAGHRRLDLGTDASFDEVGEVRGIRVREKGSSA
jgi:hypothetical protein